MAQASMQFAAPMLGLVVIVLHATAAEPLDEGRLNEARAELFSKLAVAEAWKSTKGSSEVTVGVIDNGFDYFHPDLRGRVEPGYYYSEGFHTETYTNIAHGTLVSSLIVAKDDNQGVCGLAPACKVLAASQGTLEHKLLIMQQAFFKENPKARLVDLQNEMAKQADELERFGEEWVNYQVTGMSSAIRYLVERKVRVINISTYVSRSICKNDIAWRGLEEAFEFAAEQDVIVVLSAGNSAARTEDYPGSTLDNVIVAGACMLDGERWEKEVQLLGKTIKHGSDYGARLNVMAPVENLAVCQPHDKLVYDRADGLHGPTRVPFAGPHSILPSGATSSAAPIVSSLAALVRSMDPHLDAKTTIELIEDGCIDLNTPGFDELTGHGMVNFGRTMELVTRRSPKPLER